MLEDRLKNDDLIESPYVGPRTFEENEAGIFFGREREAKDLRSLVLSERLVLFYAPSGAGKSSLINTRLRPSLQEEGFFVLPTGRVSGSLPAGISHVDNIFTFNLILRLDQGQHQAREFVHNPLVHFLAQYPTHLMADQPQLLIIDQFEEILTTNLAYWEHREIFIKQLRQAMQENPLLWVLLSLREDFVASLDPYARLLPGKLETRFRISRLNRQAALDAITGPVSLEKFNRPYEPEAAAMLVDNLRQVRLQGFTDDSIMGEFVEPVQLQAVCFQLWQNLKEQPSKTITVQDVQELGDVDQALTKFYEDAVTATIEQKGMPELKLRDWFETHLITEAGTRNMVYRGEELTGGLPTEVADFISTEFFLLRDEVRTGGIWYELSHDRVVKPILRANRNWQEKRLQSNPLARAFRAWKADCSDERLLFGPELQESLTYISSYPTDMTEEEEEFLHDSQRRETERLKLNPLAQPAKAWQAADQSANKLLQGERLDAAKHYAEENPQDVTAQERAFLLESIRHADELQVQAHQATLRRRVALIVAIVVMTALVWLAWSRDQSARRAEERANEAATAQAKAIFEGDNAKQDKVIAEAERDKANQLKATAEAASTVAIKQVNNLAAVLTAVFPTEPPVPTPTATPTASPAGIFTPPPTRAPIITPTPTSTVIPTATPNRTATIVAAQEQLAQVQATQTAVAVTPVAPNAIIGVVKTGSAVRAGPGLCFEIMFGQPSGAEVTILHRSRDGNWLGVKTGDNKQGWISRYLIDTSDEVLEKIPEMNSSPRADGTIAWGRSCKGTLFPGEDQWYRFNKTPGKTVFLLQYEPNLEDPNNYNFSVHQAKERRRFGEGTFVNKDGDLRTGELIYDGSNIADGIYYLRIFNNIGNTFRYCLVVANQDIDKCPDF